MNKQKKSIAKLLKRVLLVTLCLVLALGTTVTIMASGFNGDLDGDGKITAYDAQILAEYQAGKRDLDPGTVIGLTVRGILDRVLGRGVDEPADDGKVEKTVEVNAQDGVVTEELTFTEENVTVTVPVGVKVEGSELTLTVTRKTASDGGVTPEEGQELLPLDIHIAGVAADNEVAIVICVAGALDAGMNLGNVTLYHIENGEPVAMTQVTDAAELTAHNRFYYDPANGDITVSMATFSEVAMVFEIDKAWKGEIAAAFAGGKGTGNDPYLIANADQLAYMSKLVSTDDAAAAAHYKLISDVNMNGELAGENDRKDLMFYPIGYWAEQEGTNSANETWYDYGNTFTGTFDGNGNTIANIYQNTWLLDGNYEGQYWDAAMGLFGAVWDATIKNLTVDGFESDGEFTPTGVIAAYAGGTSTFENITIINCNPRVYNTSNGGLVGLNYNDTDGGVDRLTFKNVTVDQTNKISALWGSYDVGCGGILGRLRDNEKHTGGQVNTVRFENCHVAAIMDVYNDCCANYQYYQYRYCGMMIGTVDYIDMAGYGLDNLDAVITAEGCSVTYGDWNEYWYCELVRNTSASYTHDHQFSRLTKIADISEIKDGDTWTQEGDFVIPASNEEDAQCFHIWNVDGELVAHSHEDEGTETVDGKEILVEDRQHYYIPFGQLWTGYGWGSTAGREFEGIAVKDSGTVKSESKFDKKDVSVLQTGVAVKVGDLFEAISGKQISDSTVSVFVSPVGDTSTAGATFAPANTITGEKWYEGTLTFTGTGLAKVVITDYFYCKETVLYVGVVSEMNTVSKWVKVTDAATLNAGDQLVIASDLKDRVAGVLNSGYLTSVEASFADGVMADNADALVFTLGGTEGAWTLANSSGDQLNETAVKTLAWGTGTWIITIGEGGNATVTGSVDGELQYNASSPRFTTYASAQTPIQLYRLEKEMLDCAHAGKTTTTTVEATCAQVGSTIVTCDECGAIVSETGLPMIDHVYVNGVCTGCGVEKTAEKATITFNDKSKRTSYSTNQQVWEENGITVTNNKGSSTDNVADYANPARFYKNSELIIEAAAGNITKIEIACDGSAYTTAMENSVNGATADGNVVTIVLDGTSNTFTTKLSGGQVRVNSITVYCGESGGETPCQHTNTTTTNTATCTEAGVKTVTCDECHEVISTENVDALGHNYVDGICDNCGENEPVTEVPEKKIYTFSDYEAGTQYADNEVHKLDDNVTITTTDCHFTSELRIYSSSSYNGYAVISSKNSIVGMSFNAGNKVDTLNVYGSNDNGATWTLIQGVSVTSTSYNDYTVNFNGNSYKYLKLDVAGSNQVRVKTITLAFGESGGDTPCEHDWIAATCTAPKTCSKCGETEGAALGHTEVAVEGKAATCVETGLTEGKKCSTCGAVTVAQTEIPATGKHTYENGVCTGCGEDDPNYGGSAEPTTVTMNIYASTGTLANKVITWTSGDVTFKNAQGSSTSAIRTSDSDHFRVYAKSTVTVSAANGGKITEIVITCTSSSYATVMQTSLTEAGYTATVSDSVVTVTVNSAESITFTASAQTRLSKIEVTYIPA